MMPKTSRPRRPKPKTVKKVRKLGPTKTNQSREQKLDRRLKQYADYDAFKAGKHLPRRFEWGGVSGQACCSVVVDWEAVRNKINYFFRKLAQRNEQWPSLTEEQRRILSSVADPLSLGALSTHVLPHLPSRFKLSLNRLCFEAAL